MSLLGQMGQARRTFAREFLPHDANCKQFVNADLIAGGLSPFSPEAAALRTGDPVVIWRDGKVVWVPADQLLRPGRQKRKAG